MNKALTTTVFLAISWLGQSSVFATGNASFRLHRLSTGLDLVTVESHKVPLVTIVLAVRAGGMTEKPHTDGLTHLWEHMFFKGNKQIPNQEAFKQRVRELGIVFNGDTSAEKVRYYFTLPSANLEAGLEFMYQAISGPLLDEGELVKERKVVLDEYDRAASQPGFELRRLLKRVIYGDKFYLRDPLGQRPLIAGATKEELFKMKDEVFVPSNSALLVAGDFDPKTIKSTVTKVFNKWKDPAGWKAIVPPAFPKFPPNQSIVMTRTNTKNVSIRYVFKGPKARKMPQDTYAADILISLLNLRTGKFHKDFVESGAALSAGMAYYTQSQAGEVYLHGTATASKAQDFRKKILEAPKDWLKPNYFSQAELEDVKRILKVERLYALNKPSEYVKNLGFWWAVTGLDYYDTYLDNLLKTDLKQVQQFIKKYFIGQSYVETVFLSPDDAKQMGVQDNSGPLMKKYFPHPS